MHMLLPRPVPAAGRLLRLLRLLRLPSLRAAELQNQQSAHPATACVHLTGMRFMMTAVQVAYWLETANITC